MLTDYIGKTYDEFDCWSLVRAYLKDTTNIDLPEVQVPATKTERADLFDNHDETANWTQVEMPQANDIILMGNAGRPTHCGVAVVASGELRILHSVQGTGVVLQKPEDLVNVEIISIWRRNQ